MRHLLTFLHFLILASTCFGQDINPHTKEPFYGKYFVENMIVKKNRIKYIIDSSQFYSPGKFRVQVYDSLGRLIGDINRSFDSFDNPYVYKTKGDTTYRLKYNKDKTQLLCYERFIKNKEGQTVSYLDCCNYYFKEDNYYVGYEEFYYDEKNRLKTRLSYFKEDFPGKISESIVIKPTELLLNDVVYYTYQTLKNGNSLVIGKHGVGSLQWRVTDSTFYDKQNRITRFNSYSNKGTMGEAVANNVNRITEYKYGDSSMVITDFIRYCEFPRGNFECFTYEETGKNTTLIIYNSDKTIKAKYGYYSSNGKKYLISKYEYAYYK